MLGFITSILIARALGPEGKGYIAYFLLIFGLIASYGHLGINNATTYFQKRSNYQENEVYNVNITYLLIISFFISSIVITLKYYEFALIDYSWLIVIAGLVYIISLLLISCNNSFYIGNERIIESNKYILTAQFIYFLIIVIFFLLNKLIISTYFSALFIVTIFKLFLFTKNIKLKYKFRIDFQLLKNEFKYGIIIYFSTLFIYLIYRADQYLIKRMLGNSQLGVYSIAVTLAELVFLVPISVGTAITGKLYNIDIRSNNRKFITSKTIKYTFYVCLIVSIVGIFMTPLIPIMYGQSFTQASKVTIILFIGIIFASIGRVSSPYFLTKGKPQVHLLITSIVLFLNISLNLLLIPKFGINGAAMASTLSYIIYGLLYLYYFVTNEKFTINELLILNRLDFIYIRKVSSEFLKRIK
jgi:O-antigen/teichoic acid export membrane protein